MTKLNVLVVDDDEVNHLIATKVFQPLEWVIMHKANNGLEALQILLERCKSLIDIPDLILLDLHMPGMSGLEFLKAFKNTTCYKMIAGQIKIAVLTSSVDPMDRVEVTALGVNLFVSKPLTFEKLGAIVALNN